MDTVRRPAGRPQGGKRDGTELLIAIKSDPLILTMFFSLLLIGGDLIALRAGGLTLRLVFPVLMLAFAFLFQRIGIHIVFDRTLGFLFFLLAVAGAASVGSTLDVVKSVGYTVWVLFDFFVIIGLAYNFAKLYPPDLTLKLWFLIYRIHAVLLLLELIRNLVLIHSGDRPRLWFYETSYLAIFMTGYFGSALFMLLRCGRRYGWEFLLSLVCMLALSSATALFGMLLAVMLNFLVARQRITLLLATALLFGGFLTILSIFFRNTIYYQLAGGFLLSDRGLAAVFDLVLDRSGNRWIRALVGWDAFVRHPWLGVGIGGDIAYMSAKPFPTSIAAFVQPWMELDNGQPFVNILIEVAGTMGLAGLVPFIGVVVYAAIAAVRSVRNQETAAMAFLMAFFAIFLALQFEGTFLRYYLWTPLGLGLGILARRQRQAVPELAPMPFPDPAPA